MLGNKRPRENDQKPDEEKESLPVMILSPPPIIRQPASIKTRGDVSNLSD